MEKLSSIAVGDLSPSPWNRKEDGNGEMKELIQSIKDQGILQPLVVRADGEKANRYEIVAGHRRWAAAKEAGLKAVPCMVKKLTDPEAQRVQIIENLHRKNLNAVEEAMAFKLLSEVDGYNAQQIGDMVAKPAKYVYRSLALLGLPKKALDAIAKGILSAAHGYQLLRVGPKQIDTAVAYALTKGYRHEYPSVGSLQAYISEHMEKRLTEAPFPKDVDYATKIPCTKCPYNSANQDVLFDGAESGTCTNGACFNTKVKEFYRQFQKQGESKWPGVAFIGSASGSYGSEQTIRGYRVVDERDPKIKKLMAKEGERADGKHEFGIGILKPSMWSTIKKPKLVVLRKLSDKETEKAAPRDYEAERREEEFLRSFRALKLAEVVWDKVDVSAKALRKAITQMWAQCEWERRDMAHWLLAAKVDFDCSAKALDVSALSDLDVWRLWVFLTMDSENGTLNVLAEQSELDLAGVDKAIGEAADKAYAEALAAKEGTPK